jgi:hypothetical protein
MRSFAKRTLLLASVFVVVFAATNAFASVEGIRVVTPDTCWYRYSFIQLPVFIEWTTWSRYSDCGAEYWVEPYGDPFVCNRYNRNPECPHADHFTCPTNGPTWYDDWGFPHGCSFTQTCQLTENDETQICSFDAQFTFNPNVVNATGALNGTLMNDWGWGTIVFEYDNDAGWIRVSGASANCQDLTDLTDLSLLFYLSFEVVTHNVWEVADLQLSYFYYNEVEYPFIYWGNYKYHPTPGPCWDYHPCSLYVDNRTIGEFAVCEHESVSGKVQYCVNGLRICNARVTLEYIPNAWIPDPPEIDDHVTYTQCDPECTFDCRGSFFIGDVIDGYDYCLWVWKDDDYDDAITAYDASLIMRYMVNDFPFFCCAKVAADVSGNCGISSFDASLIMKYLVEDPMAYPYFPRKAEEQTNWVFFPCDYQEPEQAAGGDGYGDHCCEGPCPYEEICYTPLLRSYDRQNFNGVILGDVSGNWGVGPQKTAVNGVADLITYRVIEANADKTTYAISTDMADLYGFTFNVIGDANVTVIGEGWISEVNTNETRTRVAAAGARPSNGVLAHVVIESGSNVSIEGVVLNETALQGALSLGAGSDLPTTYALGNNYPNPFNPTTSISFSLPAKGEVKLAVYNILGQHVTDLASGTFDAGTHSVAWDGTDAAGDKVTSGVYLYRLETSQFVETKKMMLLK